MSLLDRQLHEAIARSHRDGHYRTLEPAYTAQGREIGLAGDALLNFSSNDYLGLAAHPALREAAHSALDRFGVGSGGSALLSGRSIVHDELERRLATFTGTEAALLYSSGYLANLGVIGALVGRHDDVFQDRLNHASLIDAVTLSRARSRRFTHADPDALESLLARSQAKRRWIVTDTVFSMDGDIAPLAEYAAIARRHGATLIGDDAHGIGVLGNGRGTVREFALDTESVPVQIITFGKAFGTAGAAVVGSAQLIDTLVQSSRTFIYDTAPPPAIAAATLAALDIIESDGSLHRRLCDNIDRFRSKAAALPLMASRTPIQPVMIGDASAAVTIANLLREQGIYLRAIRPPTVPPGTARLRVCISAAHTAADLDHLVGALDTAFATART